MSNVYGPAGGTGGNHFGANPPTIDGTWKISAVQVWSGDRIDGLEVIWTNQQGDIQTSPRVGGTGGSEHEFFIDQDDYLTRIIGSVDSIKDNVRVVCLQLFTKNGKSSDVFGRSTEYAFAYEGVPGYQIVGLFGQSGSEIDALGVVMTNSVPA